MKGCGNKEQNGQWRVVCVCGGPKKTKGPFSRHARYVSVCVNVSARLCMLRACAVLWVLARRCWCGRAGVAVWCFLFVPLSLPPFFFLQQLSPFFFPTRHLNAGARARVRGRGPGRPLPWVRVRARARACPRDGRGWPSSFQMHLLSPPHPGGWRKVVGLWGAPGRSERSTNLTRRARRVSRRAGAQRACFLGARVRVCVCVCVGWPARPPTTARPRARAPRGRHSWGSSLI